MKTKDFIGYIEQQALMTENKHLRELLAECAELIGDNTFEGYATHPMLERIEKATGNADLLPNED
jgi:hypothetical protein